MYNLLMHQDSILTSLFYFIWLIEEVYLLLPSNKAYFLHFSDDYGSWYWQELREIGISVWLEHKLLGYKLCHYRTICQNLPDKPQFRLKSK